MVLFDRKLCLAFRLADCNLGVPSAIATSVRAIKRADGLQFVWFLRYKRPHNYLLVEKIRFSITTIIILSY